MARERDEESGALYSGSSHHGLRQPRGAQGIPFKRALGCVRALIDFNMMTQYRSYTPDTVAYMEDYLDQFHRMKDIFLEFRVTKCTQAMVDKQRKEIRQQRSLMREAAAPSQRRRDDDCNEENELRMDMINAESHFNFVKMHLSHFCDHIRQFGNILMYSTEIGELVHKRQINEGWRQSNQNDPACNNPIVERVCNRQRQSSPAYANLVFLHEPVGKYYLFG